ncbi:quinone oxidoreductase family protein [Parasedimentitalea maritima]|uniref:Zinc-binding dehydrogenase n=1 Tax=Parasedimentitalea maritima TaxID=2578117 RepID=A0A6A4RCB3_9RHOB|nr:NADP-dependent oxidoreductase [Zongyanglinia marina]KAE9627326.1 zinc-binding dehydrogenase [Zongyanglinia marina]
MKAAVIETFGDADKFQLKEIARPAIAAGQILVRILASSVNPVDLGVRSGAIVPPDAAQFPMVLGWDAAGVIEEVGADVTLFQPGDRVMAITQQPASGVGTHAEFAAFPADHVTHIADNVPFDTAAATPLAATTALTALKALNLPKGASVLINNTEGAVGQIAAAMAKALQLTLVSSPDQTVDGALDVRGRDHAIRAFNRVKDGGTYVTTVPEWWKPGGQFSPDRGITPVVLEHQINQPDLQQIAAWLAEGVVTPRIETTLPLEDIAKAHRLMERPGLTQKVVLSHG